MLLDNESIDNKKHLNSRRKQKFGFYRFAISSLLLIVCVCLLPRGAMSADKSPVEIEQTQAALEEYVKIRQMISKEKKQLALDKEMLNEQIDLVQREIDLLKEKIKTANENIVEADKQRVGMIEEEEKLKLASDSLSSILAKLEQRTLQLVIQLPDDLKFNVKILSDQIPQAGKGTKLTMSQRFQNVVGLLNAVGKFNREISDTIENRDLPNGDRVEVTVMYIGLGQAYYASANGKVAGIGRATKDGWVWTPANESAEHIVNAIKILNNEKMAAFVQLPVEIK